MSDLLELEDVAAAARTLAVDRAASRWSVEFLLEVRAFRNAESTFLYVQAEAWRHVDDEYEESDGERYHLGTLRKRQGKLSIELLDGLDVGIVTWFGKLCGSRGFAVDPSPSAAALTKAITDAGG